MRIPAILHHSALAVILTIVDEILRRLLAVPSAWIFEATRNLFSSYRAELEATVWHSPLLLYISPLPVFAVLVLLGSKRHYVAKRRNQGTQAQNEGRDERSSRLTDLS